MEFSKERPQGRALRKQVLGNIQTHRLCLAKVREYVIPWRGGASGRDRGIHAAYGVLTGLRKPLPVISG